MVVFEGRELYQILGTERRDSWLNNLFLSCSRGKNHTRSKLHWGKPKLNSFFKIFDKMAENAQLPEHERERCREEGEALVKNGVIGRRWLARNVAAGLVFIALQRHHHIVSYREVENLTGVKFKCIGKTVKMLKRRDEVAIPEVTLSLDKEIGAMVDRLKIGLDQEEEIEVKRLAVGIQELVEVVKVPRGFVSRNSTANCAIVLAALEAVMNLSLEQRKEFLESFANTLKITYGSLRTYSWHVRSGLVQLAKEVPSLGYQVKSKEINSKNISRYVKTILQYKEFILRNPDRLRCASSDLPPGEGYMTKEDYSGYHFDPEEDEGNLSDLDPEEISEYIATDTEVEWSS